MEQNKKVAIITGGARGIGLATGRAMAADGWRVILADRDEAALHPLAAEFDTLALDIGDVSAVREKIGVFSAKYGRLDCLVNNAGVFRNEPLLDVEEAEYDRLMDINLKGAFFCLQAAAKAMRAVGNGGVIVNVASAAGRSGRPTQTVYGLSKAGLIHLTKSAAIALAPDIRVVCVCPAAIDTEMMAANLAQRRAVGGEADAQGFLARIPLARMGTADEVASLIAYLASDKAAYLTGGAVDISGGLDMH
jgi:NAD(P)-dependent dehydrogenase (short-subunit alcohol dehydrogenase family)